MAKHPFLRGLVYALLAGAGAPLWRATWGWSAADAYFILCVIGYSFVMGSDLRRSAKAGVLASVLGALALLTLRDHGLIVAIGAVVLGLSRSAALYPQPFARALLYEIVFIGAGGFAALLVIAPHAVGSALAHWMFWLIQAGFVLVASSTPKTAPGPRDRFERARQAAEAVLAGRSS